jgi:hypothetical protein
VTLRWKACAVLVVAITKAQAQPPPVLVEAKVAARTPNAVRVEQRFAVGAATEPIELRLLTRPCMLIHNLRVERNGAPVAGVEARKGPWITWRDTTQSRPDSPVLTIAYEAWLGGSRTIPLAVLTSVLPGTRMADGAVRVAVQFDGRAVLASDVEFPQMTRVALPGSVRADQPVRENPSGTRQLPSAWSGRYVALPSFLKVGGPAFACDRIPPTGDNGGLVWRFALLVGIMVAWVPLYLAWARRTGEDG